MLSMVMTRDPSDLAAVCGMPVWLAWVVLVPCAVPVIKSLMALLLSLLLWLFSNPATPATWGVAIEVPLRLP